MKIAYYARGGGHGHVMRGLAVLGRLGSGTLIGPARLEAWATSLGIDVRPEEEGLPQLASGDLLLVDVFPRGVVAEIEASLAHSRAWLVSRWVRPDYYLHPPVRQAIESRYERILWGEPPPAALATLNVPQEVVGPILMRPEPMAGKDARSALGVESDRPLVLALGSGDEDAQARFRRLLIKVATRVDAELRFVSDVLPPSPPVVRVFPAARVFPGADAVVSAAGYTAFHEILESGVPAVFVPQNRQVDDQFERAQGQVVAKSPEELEGALRRLLAGRHGLGRRTPDGARRIAGLIQGRTQEGILGGEQVAPMA